MQLASLSVSGLESVELPDLEPYPVPVSALLLERGRRVVLQVTDIPNSYRVSTAPAAVEINVTLEEPVRRPSPVLRAGNCGSPLQDRSRSSGWNYSVDLHVPMGNPPLFTGSGRGDRAAVNGALARTCSDEEARSWASAGLRRAALGRTELIEPLLAAGATTDGETLESAAEVGNASAIRILIAHGTKIKGADGSRALLAAVGRGSWKR